MLQRENIYIVSFVLKNMWDPAAADFAADFRLPLICRDTIHFGGSFKKTLNIKQNYVSSKRFEALLKCLILFQANFHN